MGACLAVFVFDMLIAFLLFVNIVLPPLFILALGASISSPFCSDGWSEFIGCCSNPYVRKTPLGKVPICAGFLSLFPFVSFEPSWLPPRVAPDHGVPHTLMA